MKHWYLLIFLLSTAFGNAQEAAQNYYKIYDTKQQQLITFSELASRVDGTDVLFFGEEHDDSLGHWLQDTLYTLLLNRFEDVALSLEMFETDVQLVLDEYLSGYITEDKLIKDGRAWKNYKDHYRPLVESAKEQQQSVIAANTPRRYVSIVSSEGLDRFYQLPKSAHQYLPPFPIYTAEKAYYQRFADTMEEVGHPLENDDFYHAQCTWDAGMAHSIYQYWRKHKQTMIFHLNGRFHTDYQQGTVTQLRRFSPKISIRNISCFTAEDFDQPNWSEYTPIADFIILVRE